MAIRRCPENPIIRPQDVRPSVEGFEVVGVFNAGVARHGDEIVLLLRVAERPAQPDTGTVVTALFDTHRQSIVTRSFSRNDPANDFSDPRLILRQGRTYLTSISHLRIARSSDGVGFHVGQEAAIGPAGVYETFGIEDPRITQIGHVYYVTYVAVSPLGVTTALASTRDFKTFERHGVIFCPENKDVAILPERINGRYYALHRPHSPLFQKNDLWIAESPDLISWGNHRHLMGVRAECWDERRIGTGAVPVRIDGGWLEIYHGADHDNRYCLGAVLLDADEPWKVLVRSERPLFEPQSDYERSGFFGQVVFSCGLLLEDETLRIYYGAADSTTCYAEVPLRDVLGNLGL